MLTDPEERRRKREAAAKKRKAQQKKWIAVLSAGAVLLIAVVILVVFISRGGPAPVTPTDPPPTDPPVTEPQESSGGPSEDPAVETTVPSDPTTVIHFMAGGDLNVTQAVSDAGGPDYDYSRAFLDVAALLSSADLTAINFEGNLCGAPYGASASAHLNLAYALDKAGVDILQLANSYAINRGVSGLRTTIENVRAAGMEPVGVFLDQSDYNAHKGYTVFHVKGVKVAVISFTKGMDGTTLPPGNDSLVNVLYKDYDSTYQSINTAKISSVLAAVEQEAPDITIALLHWGSEYNDTISRSQERICSQLLNGGVDAIIGTHPHYVQQMVFDQEKGTFVAYSLGDFFGDAQRAGTEYSVLLDLEITKDNRTGTTSITGYSYIPIFTVAEEGKPLRVLRIQEAMAAYESGYIDRVDEATYEDMAYALERIADRVTPKVEEE